MAKQEVVVVDNPQGEDGTKEDKGRRKHTSEDAPSVLHSAACMDEEQVYFARRVSTTYGRRFRFFALMGLRCALWTYDDAFTELLP